MSSRAAAPRILVLAAIVAAHAGVLLLLVAETRSRLARGEAETTPLVVLLLRPSEPHPAAASRARAAAGRDRASAAPLLEVPSPPTPTPTAPSAPIDWTAEAATSATRLVEADEQRARQARALLPSTGGMFSARAKRPQFHWNYARTHRIEPQPGLATVIHLNDQCAIVLFLIVPFAGGCALEKPPVRGDLFEHMHDPEPPEDLRKSELSQ